MWRKYQITSQANFSLLFTGKKRSNKVAPRRRRRRKYFCINNIDRTAKQSPGEGKEKKRNSFSSSSSSSSFYALVKCDGYIRATAGGNICSFLRFPAKTCLSASCFRCPFAYFRCSPFGSCMTQPASTALFLGHSGFQP